MITLQNITLKRGRQVLLDNVNWTIYHQQRIGIIGQNGSGKSSLFAMFLHGHHIESGKLNLPKQIRLAHVEQEIDQSSYDKTAIDFVLDGDIELRKLQQKLLVAEQENDGALIAQIHEKLHSIDAYTANARAAQLLIGLGFSHAQQEKVVSAFSGGWRVRLNLARALIAPSDVLLLDEPTNHLDLDAVIWLEEWLKKYKGTLLLISHDRDFLDKTVSHIAYLVNKQVSLYTGNYSTFEEEHAKKLITQQASYEKQQKKLLHLQSFINRFKAKASKAKQAQSRLKAIERMDIICAVQANSSFQFEFKSPEHAGNPLISLQNACIAYADKIIINHINLSIAPQDRIAIVGPNGAGKSSLIKLLAGELAPTRGERVINNHLKIGYFAQHQIDQLILSDSSLTHLRRYAAKQTELELRTFLGSFGFIGEKVLEPVQHFSGGEKSRLALALLVWQKPNLLLLDEPTNHLDLDMRQALSLALQNYSGAMLLVTHDRFLIRSTVDTLFLVAEQQLQQYDGDLDSYQQWLVNFRKQEKLQNKSQPIKNDLSKKEQRHHEAKAREKRSPVLQKINQLEKKLENEQKKLALIEQRLAEASLYEAQNKIELKEQLLLQANLKQQISRLEEEWLLACEERDSLI